MPLMMFKTLLSLSTLVLAAVALFTMLEMTGRKEPVFSLHALKSFHKINGVIYFVSFIFIGYLCLKFISRVSAELTPRSTLHGFLALSIVLAFGLKVLFVRVYRLYYPYARFLGISMVLLTFALFGTSGAYYIVSKVIGKGNIAISEPVAMAQADTGGRRLSVTVSVPVDPESIGKGKALFADKCSFCHDSESLDTIVGPGLKGILKRETLPMSGRPAIADNIRGQIRSPYRDMPSFNYLDDRQVLEIIAYLNTR